MPGERNQTYPVPQRHRTHTSIRGPGSRSFFPPGTRSSRQAQSPRWRLPSGPKYNHKASNQAGIGGHSRKGGIPAVSPGPDALASVGKAGLGLDKGPPQNHKIDGSAHLRKWVTVLSNTRLLQGATGTGAGNPAALNREMRAQYVLKGFWRASMKENLLLGEFDQLRGNADGPRHRW